MIQNLFPLIPQNLSFISFTALIGSSVFGAALWLLGARFSRQLLALAAALTGGVVGYQSTHWFGWLIDPLAMAVLGSLVCGIVGFVAHASIATLGLGMLVGAWALLGVVACVGLGNQWARPDLSAAGSVFENFYAIQRSVPSQLAIILMYAGGIGVLAGCAFCVLFRRLGVVCFWSMAGLSLLLLSVITATRAEAPKYLGMIPSHGSGQAAALAGLIAAGAAVQWKIAFARRTKARASPAAGTAGHKPA